MFEKNRANNVRPYDRTNFVGAITIRPIEICYLFCVNNLSCGCVVLFSGYNDLGIPRLSRGKVISDSLFIANNLRIADKLFRGCGKLFIIIPCNADYNKPKILMVRSRAGNCDKFIASYRRRTSNKQKTIMKNYLKENRKWKDYKK